jgi:hypothetical protein
MPVRDLGQQRRAARAPAVGARHVGFGPGFIDKHQAGGVEAVLMRPPACPPARQVRPCRLACEERFFEAEALAAHEAPDGVVRHRNAQAQVQRKRSSHLPLASCPAAMLNHISPASQNPFSDSAPR